jgi:phage tail tape-measure protein
MLTDLRRGIWSELTARQPIDIYRRNLQKSFVERMVRAIVPEASSNSQGGAATVGSSFTRTTDAVSLAKAQLRSLQADIRAALPIYKDAASRAHLQDVNDRITMALDPTRQ